jgi:dihydrolipoyl dehydrogenase
MLPNILPIEDTEVSQALEKSFAKQGVQLLTNHKTTKTEAIGEGVRIAVADPKGAEKTLEAEMALVAIGVSPVLPGGSLKIGLDEKGFIKVNDRYETTVAGIFAAGDIIGPPWLAHVASFEAIETVEGLFVPGHKPRKVTVFPGCTYCHSQVASVGLTERAAKEKGLNYRIGKDAVHSQWQGPRNRRKRGLRQGDRRRAAW